MIRQEPAAGVKMLKWVGDVLEIRAFREGVAKGRMVFRTNLGAAGIRRDEVLAQVEDHRLLSGDDWHDIPMEPCGLGQWRVKVALLEVGVFDGKVCFIPEDHPEPEWPEGENMVIKVAPENTAAGNTIYAAFTRQFVEPYMHHARSPKAQFEGIEQRLDKEGFTVIPPSGTFRGLARHLDHICLTLGFRNILLLPIHPTPTTFARMGRYGSPFAGRDFLDIDPALAEFDTKATPLDQFRELVSEVHARDAYIFMDLPANHTGWAATFMTHHPEWYRRNEDGSFHSPGAWGVVWEDLVELDYSHEALRKAIADVFLYWCRQGVDGFRCDAGYMIPKEAWDVIVALVRREYPDTIFFLEGLGGPMDITERLIGRSGLDWAYSEVFQTYHRDAFEAMLPYMLQLSEQRGPLIHFAETHDNNRLAASSTTFAKSRMMISAMLSQQGGFGITAGVEWFATEKIDVHGCGALNWGATENACALLRRLNTILRLHPLFGTETKLRQLQYGGGDVIAIVRERKGYAPLLVLANLDCVQGQTVQYDRNAFAADEAVDLISGKGYTLSDAGVYLEAGQVCCLSTQDADLSALEAALRQRETTPVLNIAQRRRRTMMMRTLTWLGERIDLDADLDAKALDFIADPLGFTRDRHGAMRAIEVVLPQDAKRCVPIVPDGLIFVKAPWPLRVALLDHEGEVIRCGKAIALADGGYGVMLTTKRRGAKPQPARHERLTLKAEMYTPHGVELSASTLLALGTDPQKAGQVKVRFSGPEVNAMGNGRLLLTNGTGAMSQIRLKWGEIQSQYDCLLGLNRHPSVPDDRQIFLTRAQVWVVCNGYTTPLTAACLEHVTVAPDGSAAEWRFAAPCGMGRRVPMVLRVAMEPGKNRVVLRFTRERRHARWRDPDVSVGLIVRPEIEWRNFHCKTKAFTGPEKTFPTLLQNRLDGFNFKPEKGWNLGVLMPGADWHYEPKWQYNVAHPEEVARGQEAASDLWSPGWFHLEMKRGDVANLVAGQDLTTRVPKFSALTQVLPSAPMLLEDAMQMALSNYIVRRDDHKTVIAGYPWFLDWGRDTLIFLRGVAAAGRWDEVFDALTEFGRFEKGGTIPNMIRGEDDANRETVDAPLWFAVICDDAIAAFGAKRVLEHPCGERTLKDILVSIAEHYIKGTENGIRVDAKTGLVWAPHHYTWMDTNYPAGTPRNGYSVEIQALWVRLLDLLGREVDPKWKRLATRVRRSFKTYFPLPEGGLSDCLYAEAGVSAMDAVADDAIRPNQLYAVTLGLLKNDKALARSVIEATMCLITPGAIRTLANAPVKRALPIVRDGRLLNDPYRPYWGRYEGDEDTRRKPAYHNGTGWTFPFPLFPEAIFLVEGERARKMAQALLASGSVLANIDCVTQLPECSHGDAPHEPCGTGAQAWGVSEFARVGLLLAGKQATQVK